MWQRFGDGFTGEYFGLHVLQRASSQMEGHRTHAWYFLWVLLVSAPPWVLLYVSGLWAALRKEEMRSLRPLAIFALVVVLLFSAVQTRLPHYVAPAYPALSAVAAAVLVRWMRAPLAAWRAAGARVGWGAVAAGVWAGMVIVTAHARKQLHSPRMSNGMVTPDTHEPAALLKASRTLMTGYRGPLLLMAEPPIAPMTTAMFYARRPVVQVEVQPAQPQLPRDVYTWDPEPLEQQAGTAPRLMLVERVALDGLPADLDFVSLANSAHWEIGTVERRDAAQSAGAGPD
jgi:4-amino-4-deoxy-L-arabinose transferase-like glycosyltransferase